MEKALSSKYNSLQPTITLYGSAGRLRTDMIFLSRDFKQIKINLDYLIAYNFTCLGIGRSCLLLRRLTSQVVSTPSKDLSLAWLALNFLIVSAEFNRLFDIHFCIKGTHSTAFPCVFPFHHSAISNLLLHYIIFFLICQVFFYTSHFNFHL